MKRTNTWDEWPSVYCLAKNMAKLAKRRTLGREARQMLANYAGDLATSLALQGIDTRWLKRLAWGAWMKVLSEEPRPFKLVIDWDRMTAEQMAELAALLRKASPD